MGYGTGSQSSARGRVWHLPGVEELAEAPPEMSVKCSFCHRRCIERENMADSGWLESCRGRGKSLYMQWHYFHHSTQSLCGKAWYHDRIHGSLEDYPEGGEGHICQICQEMSREIQWERARGEDTACQDNGLRRSMISTHSINSIEDQSITCARPPARPGA